MKSTRVQFKVQNLYQFRMDVMEEYDLKIETLDNLYMEQLTDLRALVSRNIIKEDADICCKWLKVFNNSAKSEKMARNCLCTLMHEQLNNTGRLHYPFTILENCNRNLDSVLRDIDIQSTVHSLSLKSDENEDIADGETSAINKTKNTVSDEEYSIASVMTYNSHTCKSTVGSPSRQQQDQLPSSRYTPLLKTPSSQHQNKNHLPQICPKSKQCSSSMSFDIDFSSDGNDNDYKINKMNIEYDIKTLRLDVAQKNIEINKLREIIEKLYQERNESYDLLDKLKRSILVNIDAKLTHFEEYGVQQTDMKLFETILQESMKKEAKLIDNARDYDRRFEIIIHNYFEHEFNKRKLLIARQVSRKLLKNKAKMRAKFEQKLTVQGNGHRLQIKLNKLKCFSVLRQIIINTYNENENLNLWEILKILEDKYRQLLNDT